MVDGGGKFFFLFLFFFKPVSVLGLFWKENEDLTAERQRQKVTAPPHLLFTHSHTLNGSEHSVLAHVVFTWRDDSRMLLVSLSLLAL